MSLKLRELDATACELLDGAAFKVKYDTLRDLLQHGGLLSLTLDVSVPYAALSEVRAEAVHVDGTVWKFRTLDVVQALEK